MKQKLQYIFITIVFLLGIYYCMTVQSKTIYEGYSNNTPSCPDILIQKGSKIYLYNSKKAKIPGVNPIEFDNLEDYVQYLDWQKHYNINCPILYLQHSYNAQGGSEYRARPSPLDPQGGLPSSVPAGEQAVPMTKLMDAGRNDPPYNQNSYPAFDPMNLNQGDYTPLDKMFHEGETSQKYSANAMDTNWGGEEYAQAVVDSGAYSEDNVSIAIS